MLNLYFDFNFGLLKTHWKNLFLSKTWQTRMILLVIDEAHCISEWGENSVKQEYQQLSELRSFFQTPVMTITGTSTKKS